MKIVGVVSALLAGLGFAGTAIASDLSFPVPPPPSFSWQGFYVGVNGGFGGDRFDYSLFEDPDPVPVATADLTSSGFVYGGQIGYNFLVGPSFVLGVEADIQGSTIEGNLGIVLDPALNAHMGSSVDWFGTVRGRAGWAYDRFLLYVTGGWAYGRTTAFINGDFIGPFSLSQSFNGNGWTAGVGGEVAITDNWTLKTEYLYVDLGTATIASGGGYSLTQDTHFHVVRAGLNYKFGG